MRVLAARQGVADSMPYAPGGTPVWTRYTYDAMGRTLTVTAPDGATRTTYGYSGNTTTVTDAAVKWKSPRWTRWGTWCG